MPAETPLQDELKIPRPDPYGQRTEVLPGHIYVVRLPHSEAMMSFRQAGHLALVKIEQTGAETFRAFLALLSRPEDWIHGYAPSEIGIKGYGTPSDPFTIYTPVPENPEEINRKVDAMMAELWTLFK